MPIYLLYIEDGRYSAPQLDSLAASDDAQVIAQTRKRLDASPHYISADVWEDDRFVARILGSESRLSITSP
jgi:hypothetical protein